MATSAFSVTSACHSSLPILAYFRTNLSDAVVFGLTSNSIGGELDSSIECEAARRQLNDLRVVFSVVKVVFSLNQKRCICYSLFVC